MVQTVEERLHGLREQLLLPHVAILGFLATREVGVAIGCTVLCTDHSHEPPGLPYKVAHEHTIFQSSIRGLLFLVFLPLLLDIKDTCDEHASGLD